MFGRIPRILVLMNLVGDVKRTDGALTFFLRNHHEFFLVDLFGLNFDLIRYVELFCLYEVL